MKVLLLKGMSVEEFKKFLASLEATGSNVAFLEDNLGRVSRCLSEGEEEMWTEADQAPTIH